MQELRRESLLVELRQRIRDVRQGPDGLLYVLTDADPGAVLRIEPVEVEAGLQTRLSPRTIAMEVLFAGRFAGIPREAFTFFKGLASHNNREWFQANKSVYEKAVRGPMQSLLAELAPTYGGSGKLTRINRDMRFARGQAPYKTFIASIVGRHYISHLERRSVHRHRHLHARCGDAPASPRGH